MNNRKIHWDTIYSNSDLPNFTWSQHTPSTFLWFLNLIKLPTSASIIDIGGGDSNLVDHLLDLGFEDITVLDISQKAIEKTQKRLGDKANKVNWIISDIIDFTPNRTYDFWYDRATFHFLSSSQDINQYNNIVKRSVKENGYMLISTFSDKGPSVCSGLNVTQYSKPKLTEIFEPTFDRMKCAFEDHMTPKHQIQNFIFCLFKHRTSLSKIQHNELEDEYFNRITIANDTNLSCDINNKGNCCS